MSSNPFRKKLAQQDTTSASPDTITSIDPPPIAAAIPPPRTSFRANAPPALPALPPARVPGKVFKKVRVLSPPPRTPDAPEWPLHAPPDPFDTTAQQQQQPSRDEEEGGDVARSEVVEKEEVLQEERREEGAVLKAANPGPAGASLDVNSFHRLLMTGSAGLDGSPAGSGASTLDVLPSTARSKSVNDLATASPERYGGSVSSSDSEDAAATANEERKAPPPPPSSRHGKSLRMGSGDDRAYFASPSLNAQPTDLNKPLPMAPSRNSIDDESESPFDHESAGLVPEPESYLPPPTQNAKKNVPAPPPRRGHARSDTRSNTSSTPTTNQVQKLPDDDISDSPSENIRPSTQAPAPPPPRRPFASNNRPPSLQASSTTPSTLATASNSSPTASSQSSTQPSSSEPAPSSAGKTTGPPLPPARQTSSRKSPSNEAAAPRAAHAPPPPPRPRQARRGSSRSSIDGGVVRGGAGGVDILADLTALQREVDAMRGRGP